MPQVIKRKLRLEAHYVHPMGSPWALRVAYKDLKGVAPGNVDVFVRGYGPNGEVLYQRVGTYAGAIRDHYDTDGLGWAVFTFNQVNHGLMPTQIILVITEKGEEE